eukprot:TRINITY_DN2139_c0_g1_i1.p1 TRINITY_DN2139_c0_g1~~TRINITY_DN2139_c0_g1_i1.p1  ORF type:complete len:506 (-),score=168.70 TRINITY_DN2139_c0_g1_i1:120-1637(-)
MASAPRKEEAKEKLSVKDSRTGKEYTVPIGQNAVNATDFKNIKTADPDDVGLVVYDGGYFNTACCKSQICKIDGDKGVLTYRGYDIEELVEKSTFLEVAYLLIYGELPNKVQKKQWETTIMRHTFIHENLVELMQTFRYDAHPMGILISSISAMGTFYPDANPALQGSDLYQDPAMRNKQIFRILGKIPTIAACAYRHRIGRPYNNPVNYLSYVENFMYMLDRLSENNYRPHPVLARALDKIWILHADHELNCSTATMRQISSTLVDPYTATSGAAGALYGPLHGGANEAVLRMLEQIGTPANVPAFLQDVKDKKKILFGFGHRIYKNYDPRAKVMKDITFEVFDVLGKNPLMEIAIELEKQALADEYFITRKLFPNVDFYSGLIYNAMGFPTDMFPVLFCIPRVAGWLAHWVEALQDPAGMKIYRPRQIYTGLEKRIYIAMENRNNDNKGKEKMLATKPSLFGRRRNAAEKLAKSTTATEITTSGHTASNEGPFDLPKNRSARM